jgi:hypothetical protein
MVLQYTSNYQKLLDLYDGVGFKFTQAPMAQHNVTVKTKTGVSVPLYLGTDGGNSSGNYLRIDGSSPSSYYGYYAGISGDGNTNPLFPLRPEIVGCTIKRSASNYEYTSSTRYSPVLLSFGTDNTTPSSSDYTLTDDLYMTNNSNFSTSNVTYYISSYGNLGKSFITIRNGTSNTVTLGEVGIYLRGYNGGTQALAEKSHILLARGAFNNTITLSQGEGVTFDVSCIL